MAKPTNEQVLSLLSADQILALSKIKLPSGARDAVAPGEYSGQATVTVSYKLKVGNDYEQNIVAKADPWALLAVALSKLNGVTVDVIVRESVDGSISAETIKAEADAAIQKIKATTKSSCKGKVTGDVEITAVLDQP